MSDTTRVRPAAASARPPHRGRSGLRAAITHPALIGGVALLALWLFANQEGSYPQYVIILIAIYALVGAAIVLLIGVGGQLSLGHAVFFAVGAYTAAQMSTRSSIGLPLEIVIAAAIAAVVGAVVGLPSLRLSGLLLAAGTLALGFAGQQVLFTWEPVTGGSSGMSVGLLQVFGQPASLLNCTIIVLGVCLLLTYNILRGRSGRALHALRTAETAARSVGIDVGVRRIVAFALSGALTAVAGVLYGHAVSFISPDTFGYTLSIQLVVLAIIGGRMRLFGAVLGAAFVFGLPEQFRSVQKYEGTIYGVILLIVIIFAPGGIVELFDRARGAVTWLFGRATGRPVRSPEEPELIAAVADEPVPGHGRARVGESAPVPPTRSGRRSRLRVAPAEGAQASLAGLPLTLSGVSVSFGGVHAVRDVSLEIPPGQVLGLIGPNGAGKTTLFNALSGVVRASGSVVLGDTDLSRSPVRRRALAGLGRTFQNLSLHEGLTTLDHVLIGRHRFYRYSLLSESLRLPGVIRSERQGRSEAMALLELVGLAEVADVRVDDLPYGLQKRVDMARALAGRPRILLLDEPAAGLPPDEADELIDQVLALTCGNGTTVVIIEHNVELVRRVCDRLVAMAVGAILEDGAPQAVLESDSVVEAYLGG